MYQVFKPTGERRAPLEALLLYCCMLFRSASLIPVFAECLPRVPTLLRSRYVCGVWCYVWRVAFPTGGGGALREQVIPQAESNYVHGKMRR